MVFLPSILKCVRSTDLLHATGTSSYSMNLVLSDTNHLNATYTQEDGTPMYRVTTPFAFFSTTATIERAISSLEQGTAAASTAHRYEFLAQVEFHSWSSSILHIEREEVKTSVFFTEGGFTLRPTLGRYVLA